MCELMFWYNGLEVIGMYEADVIVVTDKEGNMKPLRVRIEENDEQVVIRVKDFFGAIKLKDRYIYNCECSINNMMKTIKLFFYPEQNKWYCNI